MCKYKEMAVSAVYNYIDNKIKNLTRRIFRLILLSYLRDTRNRVTCKQRAVQARH